MRTGDVWAFFTGESELESALEIYTIVTMSAAASEMISKKLHTE
ncbi:MAG: hypothetical protein NTY39_13025 [Campylobacterales bacterium]|nr:hypothetical protein [Campylobacterales bacterium]